MERRAFIVCAALATLGAPRVTRAQPARKVYRIGILSLRLSADMAGPQPQSPACRK